MLFFILIKVACRVQKWKIFFFKISDKSGYSLIKMILCLCITKKPLSKSI